MTSSFLAFIVALLLCVLLVPSVRAAVFPADDFLDLHESSKSRVATRSPFRESGPPACMAQLIMLRHKLNQTTHRKRRSSSHGRQSSRSQSPARSRSPAPGRVSRRDDANWVRLGRTMGRQTY